MKIYVSCVNLPSETDLWPAGSGECQTVFDVFLVPVVVKCLLNLARAGYAIESVCLINNNNQDDIYSAVIIT